MCPEQEVKGKVGLGASALLAFLLSLPWNVSKREEEYV